MKNRPLTWFTTSIVSLCFLTIISISCSKEKSDTGDTEQEQITSTTAEADVEAEVIFNGIFDDVMGTNDDVGMAGTGWYGRNSFDASRPGFRVTACYTVTVTHLNPPAIFPKRVVIEFDPAGCPGPDGHVRKGKIITDFTARLILPGAVATTTFENFYIDSVKVDGTHKITNTSSPINTQPLSRSFKFEVINGKLTKPSGNYVEWNSTKTVVQMDGLVTPDRPIDDVFKIEGHARGKAQRGNLVVVWESNTVEPLIKKFFCRWITKGRIRTVRASTSSNTQWVATLDFGPGTCDNKAMLTVNGRSHEITLP